MPKEFDNLDARIIVVLAQDGRRSNADIARQLGSSEATVRRRIDAMVQDGIFQVIALADPERIGFSTHALFGIAVEPTYTDDVAAKLATFPFIRLVMITSGPFNLMAQGYFAGRADLASFLIDELNHIRGIVKIELVLVHRTIKRNWEYQLSAPALSEPPDDSSHM